MRGLSTSLTEMNTVPARGRPDPPPIWLLAKAISNVWSSPITSPVERSTIVCASVKSTTGIEPLMARATVARLRWKESLGLKEHFNGVVPENYKIAIDAIVAKTQAGVKAAE